jgi:hypothetical protein
VGQNQEHGSDMVSMSSKQSWSLEGTCWSYLREPKASLTTPFVLN